jgi:hypothetical protein
MQQKMIVSDKPQIESIGFPDDVDHLNELQGQHILPKIYHRTSDQQ